MRKRILPGGAQTQYFQGLVNTFARKIPRKGAPLRQRSNQEDNTEMRMKPQKTTEDQPKLESNRTVHASNRGGRPRKAAEELNSETFILYMTPAESNQLRHLHQQVTTLKKISLNQFVKDRIVQAKTNLEPGETKPLTEPQFNKLLATLIHVDGLLTRLTTNYNQSVKRLNSMPISKAFKEEIFRNEGLLLDMKNLKQELKTILDQVKNYIS